MRRALAALILTVAATVGVVAPASANHLDFLFCDNDLGNPLYQSCP